MRNHYTFHLSKKKNEEKPLHILEIHGLKKV